MDKRGVALLGAGRIAARHIRAMQGTGALRCEWVISRTGEHASAMASEHGVGHHGTDPMQALSDPAVDVIVVAYPTQEHAQLTLAALAAGKDVICEKPLRGRRTKRGPSYARRTRVIGIWPCAISGVTGLPACV